jgi:transposase
MGDHHLLSVPRGGCPMRPPRWPPPLALSLAAHALINRIRRAQLLVVLRQHRHALCADVFPQARRPLSTDPPPGQPPVPPAPLALATMLPASTRVSADAGMEATTMARRWHLGLDGLDGDTPPFSNGPLVALRQRWIAPPMARRLRARTRGPRHGHRRRWPSAVARRP